MENNNRLRWLQYRIIHRILPTNHWLYKIGIINNPNCTKCNKNVVETLNHLFLECNVVEKFWSSFISQWDFIFHDISDDEKLFGIIDEKSENWELKNHLLLIAKRYIYIDRCKGSTLSVRVFNVLLKDTARLEEIIARQKGKLVFHYKKWSG